MKKLNKIMAGIMAVSLCMAGNGVLSKNGFISDISIKASAEIIKSGTCGENLTYTLDDLGTLTISGTGDMANYEWAFAAPWYDENVEKIIIEDGVTSIGEYAFWNCLKLTEITIPDSVISIGEYAFLFCTGLTEISIPDSVTNIDVGAFAHCTGLTSITIPDSVTSIGEYVFSDTLWLEAKQKENPLVIVNDILIDGTTCSGDVVISDNVTSIGNKAFERCDDITSVTIPDSVINICGSAFEDCSSLTSITIPDSVTSIGSRAFFGCSSLTSVTIPHSVKSIGIYAFNNCKALTKITVLNPECEIYDDSSTIGSNTTIYGYANSTAQAYAEKYNYKFEPIGEAPVFDSGDVNNDGYIDSVDATVISMEYANLATGKDATLSDEQQKSADVNGDGLIDAVDSNYILRYYAKVSAGQNITFAEFIANN